MVWSAFCKNCYRLLVTSLFKLMNIILAHHNPVSYLITLNIIAIVIYITRKKKKRKKYF